MCINVYRITVDYSLLPDHLKDLEDPDEIKKLTDKMAKTMAEQSMKLQKIHAPNFKVNLQNCNIVKSLKRYSEILDTVAEILSVIQRGFSFTTTFFCFSSTNSFVLYVITRAEDL